MVDAGGQKQKARGMQYEVVVGDGHTFLLL
jgi:hypothetical protein